MKIQITATISETQSKHPSYIYISRKDQHYFPEPNKKFKIIDPTNDKEYVVHLENSYRIPGLKGFFKSHSEIGIGVKIPIEQMPEGSGRSI